MRFSCISLALGWTFFAVMMLVAPPAQALRVDRQNDRIFLGESNDPDCGKLRSLANDFSNWKSVSDRAGCDPQKLSFQSQGNQCRVDSTECLPKHVQTYQGVRPQIAGPNCWNTALVLAGLLPNLRYSSPEEFSFYMRPPICRQLNSTESRRPGDIGAIRRIENGQIIDEHAFIHINEKITYSKNGWGRQFPYALQSPQSMSRGYGVAADPSCQGNQLNPSCAVSTEYFRCQSMGEYLKNSQNTPPELLQLLKQTTQFESCIDQTLMQGAPLSPMAMQNIHDTAYALAKYLQTQSEKTPPAEPNSEEEFMLGALKLRIVAIAEQLDLIDQSAKASPILSQIFDRGQ